MTSILVISDIHANIVALEAVLADAGPVEQVWCLGDIAGYAAKPNECIERIRSLPGLCCMMGNHDYAAAGVGPLAAFNGDAKKALLWQIDRIKPENKEFLGSNSMELIVKDNISLAHGSPRDPIWEYILNSVVARMNLAYFRTTWCFVGHSHFQAIFEYHDDQDEVVIKIPKPGEKYSMKDRAILNPGSVGQPRDRDPRAAYALLDPDGLTWEPRRVAYDISSVQQQILNAGLPPRHAERLAGGW
jgi:diadenosine tetraphosphatase ApaH/serine/threonine PP2A family protein phosphatase